MRDEFDWAELVDENARLRAELAECQRAWHAQVNAELRPAEAAIARARALCASELVYELSDCNFVYVEDVLRALDGSTE